MKIVRRHGKPVRIEMLPLIDIVFLLLIFFIYAMLSMAVHRGLDLDLPESAVTTISDQSTWAISIKRRNTAIDIYLEEQRIQLDDLTRILADQPDERKVQPVLLFADEEVSYQQLFTVL
ncbi:MAG TPA: biopolymer transporter ExbD, partial [Desulfofustis sp.]|nr:biopolymer transporter ExbD [Desulfofustis sp.]